MKQLAANSADKRSKILIVDDDLVTTTWLRNLLEKEKYAVAITRTGHDALERVSVDPPDLILLDRVLPDADGLTVCRKLRQQTNTAHIWIIVLTAKSASEDVLGGLHAGADDYIIKRRGADVELLAKIATMLRRTARAAGTPTGLGRIISFFSAKGGSGTTMIAVNTAYALQSIKPQSRVLLVDMVFPLGSVGLFLDFHSSDTLAKLSREGRGRIDAQSIAQYISPPQRNGFRVLLSAHDLQDAQVLEVAQIAPIFDTLRAMYDFILVDLGRALSRITLPTLENSDLVFVIVSPDVTAVALTKASLEFLHSSGVARERIVVVQNRTVPRVWMSREDMEKEIGVSIPLNIPYDGEQLPTATNSHVPYLERYENTVTGMSLREVGRIALQRLDGNHASP